ncbi:transcriptional regulator, XRE family with cupin sensor [Seinonella peptonophila]|uniref:Transcriptional regulator, XRE family with cupin sensor n=1 Tax=Seinonella peptonophila TaxID=112248 RepID=A0A1M5B1W0_9BACL|nr:XRE family transcriptional regulator [Seinonella peptonophila]SHF36468.1 transcriptional regulator, XRE family with cupin sensor [Seinonella peptonophila]
MEEIHLIVAKNLKTLRKSKKLSLEKVAELSGVSKTMIGQIERGESSPTITTIWKIANGLKVSFTSLLNYPQPETTVISKADVQMLDEDNGKYRAYPYFLFDEDKRFEVYSVEIDPGGKLESTAHKDGTEEFIIVFEGELTIDTNNQHYKVKPGDCIKFKADDLHSYYNTGKKTTHLSMIIYYGT